MEIEKEARRRLTLAHESWRAEANHDSAFATALRYRLSGMIEMYMIVFPNDDITFDDIMAALDRDALPTG